MGTEEFDIYKDSDFHFFVIERGASLELHCNVFKWSKVTLKRMLLVFDLFKGRVAVQGYQSLTAILKNKEFAKIFGGDHSHDIVVNGETYGVFIWELKQAISLEG